MMLARVAACDPVRPVTSSCPSSVSAWHEVARVTPGRSNSAQCSARTRYRLENTSTDRPSLRMCSAISAKSGWRVASPPISWIFLTPRAAASRMTRFQSAAFMVPWSWVGPAWTKQSVGQVS